MYPLVVLLKMICIKAIHCELYIKVIRFGALHFGVLLEFDALEFDILEFSALSSMSKFCTLQLDALSFESKLCILNSASKLSS
jgi:hypothetical protein